MEPNTVRFLVWLAVVAITWVSARAVIAVLKSDSPDNTKATWIAAIVCTPLLGAVAYWLLSGGFEFSKGTPEEREALLKNRLNKE
jgi:hypothetical protein